jgi:pteridine reductase
MPSSASTPLAGKVALVTGGARRVGAAIVRGLHAAGADVVVHCRASVKEATALERELNAARAHSVALVSADLLQTAVLPKLMEAAHAAFGRLDILVNNASTFYPTPLGAISEAQWNDLIGVNLKAPLFLSQAAAQSLHLARGLILNIVDIHGVRPLRRHAVYCVAKAALIMLTKSLARELGPHVRVNAIAPGPILWPEEGADSQLQSRIIDRTALKRQGSPEDIVKAVLFFAAEAPYVTGQILAVDGGRSIGW